MFYSNHPGVKNYINNIKINAGFGNSTPYPSSKYSSNKCYEIAQKFFKTEHVVSLYYNKADECYGLKLIKTN